MREGALEAGVDAPVAPPDGQLLPEARYRLPDWFQVDSLLKQWAQQWDVVVAAEAPEIGGDEVEFVALADGTLVVDVEEGDASLEPLARAVEAELRSPYRAKAVRHERGWWAVGARPTTVCALPGVDAESVELTRYRGERTVSGASPDSDLGPLERLAADRGLDDYALQAERLDGDLFEVQLSPL